MTGTPYKMTGTPYKNKHTGEIAYYLRSETIPNYPDPIRVHTLLHDDDKEHKWNDHFFFANWDYVPDRDFARQSYDN